MSRGTAWLLAGTLLTVACGGEAAESPPPDPRFIVEEAAGAMADVDSARFAMERTGAPVEIEGMEFQSAEGEYASPDAARAILKVTVGDLAVELGTIAIGDRVWLTNPLTGGWDEYPAGAGFNPAIVFDSALGWVPLLTDDLGEPLLVGTESGAYVIRGTVAPARVELLTSGLVEAQSVVADIHIDTSDYRIVKVVFSTQSETGESDWNIELDDYDTPVTIEPPPGA